MNKKLFSTILAMILVVTILPIRVIAEEMKFEDVELNAWYYDDVKFAVSSGLLNGKTATRFAPSENLTYAEAVKLAACMHQKALNGSVTLQNGDPWYKPFVDYAKANGIITKEYDWDASATRGGYIEIFVKALPNLQDKNEVPDGIIPDVPMDNKYAPSIYKFYRAGIIQGVDSEYNCLPEENVERGAVAAILSRMMQEEKRLAFNITEKPKDANKIIGFNTPIDIRPDLPKNNYDWIRDKNILDDARFKEKPQIPKPDLQIFFDLITEQPKDGYAYVGEFVDMKVETNTPIKRYTWSYRYADEDSTSWRDIPDLNSKFISVKIEAREKLYRCLVLSEDDRLDLSDAAKAIAVEPIKIISQPQNVYNRVGREVELKVEATGYNLSYQWWKEIAPNRWEMIYESGGQTNTLRVEVDHSPISYRCSITDGTQWMHSVQSQIAKVIPSIQ